MLTKADDYPIHQTPDPIAFSGTDRNFYDRYFFNGYSTDGEVYFGAALGVYPYLGIMDAAFAVRIGDVQYNLHASRHLNMERMDTSVGPVRVEVVEPLRKLRVVVEDNEHGISADLLFEGRHAPLEEPRTLRRNGSRLVQDITRMTQLGRWSGRITAGGREIALDPASTLGTRDRSWGIRAVGLRDPQQPAAIAPFQVWWFWVPAHFADRIVHFYVNEDGAGKVWNAGMVVIRDDGQVEHLRDARLEVQFRPGTRFPAHGTVTATDEAGGSYRMEIEPGRSFFLSGIGYMNPDWAHGLDKGPLAVGYDEIPSIDSACYGAGFQHPQAFAKVSLTLPDGRILPGHGCFESIMMGGHEPSGLTSMYDVP